MADLKRVLKSFEQKRVLLLGDTILDIYTYGSAMGLSAETPTIVARKKESRYSLGGAALVCRNLLELGAAVDFITLIGEDEEAAHVRAFSSPRLHLMAVPDSDRPTTVKHRFWVDGYKLFQLDQRKDEAVSMPIVDRVVALVDEALPHADLVVISDYRHGLLSADLITRLLEKLHATGKPVYVDSQVSQNASNHKLYRGNCILALNLREAQSIDPSFVPSTEAAAFATLNRELDTQRLLIKLGARGAIFQNGSEVVQAPASKVEALDTTGAGDAFLSAFCLGGPADPVASLRLANAWAGLAVQIHGTVPPSKDDLTVIAQAG